MPKRKRSSVAQVAEIIPSPPTLPTKPASLAVSMMPAAPVRRTSSRKSAQPPPAIIDANPDTNTNIEDGQEALRASPDADEPGERFEAEKVTGTRGKAGNRRSTPKPKAIGQEEESSLSEVSQFEEPTPIRAKGTTRRAPVEMETVVERGDPEDGEEENANPEEMKEALSRAPPVNSPYLPLPWKGRLGYACLNTYLRASNPPVFSSRTCRIASILEHRHPLKDPSQPEHATKNRPDKAQSADVARGQAYVEALGLANARDIPKMLRWNDRYGIKFMRLSSEMFPFASHDVYGYRLAPFAAEALAEAGRVAAELGHRLSTHPGQFTQLGSPRPEVITAAVRDLEYHAELLELLRLPHQADLDAVMILHMGGIFGDKAATLDRFRRNYKKLPPSIQKRLVLENDDVCYSVHDLMPVCEELNIPLVLDYHHHNIIFDSDKIREGTLDIMELYPRIKATWDRKGITQKMHYSEPTPGAITGRQRRKHNPRVATLPPCPPDMDLMIEAKDKEQAVFELMRTFKLPGFDTFNDILPHIRGDENKPWKPPKKKTPKKRSKKAVDQDDEELNEPDPQPQPVIPDEEVGMGGHEGRVYWPPGMEEWLRPKKREVKPRDPEKAKTTAEKAAARRAEKAAWQAARERSAGGNDDDGKIELVMDSVEPPKLEAPNTKSINASAKPSKRASVTGKKKKGTRGVPTPSTSDHDDDYGEEDVEMSDLTDADVDDRPDVVVTGKRGAGVRRQSGRGAKRKAVVYAEDDEEEI